MIGWSTALSRGRAATRRRSGEVAAWFLVVSRVEIRRQHERDLLEAAADIRFAELLSRHTQFRIARPTHPNDPHRLGDVFAFTSRQLAHAGRRANGALDDQPHITFRAGAKRLVLLGQAFIATDEIGCRSKKNR